MSENITTVCCARIAANAARAACLIFHQAGGCAPSQAAVSRKAAASTKIRFTVGQQPLVAGATSEWIPSDSMAELPVHIAATTDDKRLREVRLDLAYIPTPFREQSVRIHVGLPGGP